MDVQLGSRRSAGPGCESARRCYGDRSSERADGEFDVSVEQARRGSKSASLVFELRHRIRQREEIRSRDGRLESEALAAQDEQHLVPHVLLSREGHDIQREHQLFEDAEPLFEPRGSQDPVVTADRP